ncbi:MAG TPA: hypothetical protein VF676_13010 [Flavobacterium sp.]
MNAAKKKKPKNHFILTRNFLPPISSLRAAGNYSKTPETALPVTNPIRKIIGPSLQEISKIYKEKNGNIVLFLQEKAEPIVDPGQYSVMKTNFAITKKMPEEDLKALEKYILSH